MAAKRTYEEGKRLIAEFKVSGLSQAKFVEKKGIKQSSLQYWLRRVRKAEDKPELQFVEVVAKDNGSIRLELPGGAAVHFDMPPSPEYLAHLALELSKRIEC